MKNVMKKIITRMIVVKKNDDGNEIDYNENNNIRDQDSSDEEKYNLLRKLKSIKDINNIIDWFI